MNIIENVWNKLEVNYNRRSRHACNEDELFEMLQEEWANLSKEYCDKLYASTPHRVTKLQIAKGYWTGYWYVFCPPGVI
jgi:hypothetical protein